MKYNILKNSVLLLTGCINPNGMKYTALLDPKERERQYFESVKYYLEKTSLRVVFCENTNYTNFYDNFKQHQENGRFEYLTFNGNDYDKKFGKGYGEAIIITYALKNSTFIKSCNYIVKITGRTPLVGICKYFYLYKLRNNTVLVDIPYKNNNKSCDSRAVFAPKSFYYNYFIKDISKINDTLGYYFEHHLYNAIEKALKDKQIKLKLIFFPFIFKGVSGTTAEKIKIGKRKYINTFIHSIILSFHIKKGYIK